MAWLLPEREAKIYERNPLSEVVAEVRFHPILKIANGKAIDDVQELLRQRFPKYSLGNSREIAFDSNSGNIRVNDEKQHVFTNPQDTARIRVTSSSYVFQDARHRSRDALKDCFSLGLDCLQKTYGPLAPQRLGLRYINVIDPVQIVKLIGGAPELSRFVDPEYLSMPKSLSNEETKFGHEFSAPIRDGHMALRFGTVVSDNMSKFRFDVDRFIDGDLTQYDLPSRLLEFAADIYLLFETMATDDLREWMSMSEKSQGGSSVS